MATNAQGDGTGIQLAVSTVIFALRTDDAGVPRLQVPLVRRIREPFDGFWALPGGPLGADEALGDAAARHLRDTTGLEPGYLEQLYAFGSVDRSPSERVVSIVYWALVSTEEAERARRGQNIRWFEADDLPPLAFDHAGITAYALWRLRSKLEYTSIAHAFLGERFTLAQLRAVYEAVLQRPIDPANFRRTVEAEGHVIATDEYLTGTRHRPPRLYRFDGPAMLADRGPLPSL